MTAAPTTNEVVTAAVLVIGDEILSGRTKDKNIGFIADYLTAIGIDLNGGARGRPRRGIGDRRGAQRSARALHYVFTTGGIGPTHDDITADCIAKAFGVPIDVDPRALAILEGARTATGSVSSTRPDADGPDPEGRRSRGQQGVGAPGFWIENVIVMAGVPSIMQAMLDEVAPKLKTGVRLLSETVRANAREGDIGGELGEIAKANPEYRSAAIRSSIRSSGRTPMSWCVRRCRQTCGRQTRGRGDAGAGAGRPATSGSAGCRMRADAITGG